MYRIGSLQGVGLLRVSYREHLAPLCLLPAPTAAEEVARGVYAEVAKGWRIRF